MKHSSKLFALLLALAMIVSTFSISFAKQPALKMVQDSMFKLPDEESGEDLDVSDVYQTGRIMVCPGRKLDKDFLKDTDDAIFYNGWYFLQYDSENATKTAYKALKQEAGPERRLHVLGHPEHGSR